MKILEFRNIENYRYAVAKALFMLLHPDAQLLENHPHSNQMLVYYRQRRMVVSMFGKPTSAFSFQQPVTVFYQNKRKTKNDYDSETLNENFNSLYAELIAIAFGNPEELKVRLSTQYEIFIEPMFVDPTRPESLPYHKVYKYYSRTSLEGKRKDDLLNGALSFCRPDCFNDPFDCTCYFRNAHSMMNYFRVLCLTELERNILMWSYYAENHTGYCFAFDFADVIEKIAGITDIHGICLIGNVNYKKNRPVQKSSSNHFSWTNLNFYADATFTKFEEWKHERELRLVIYTPDFQTPDKELTDVNKFYVIHSDIQKLIVGCKGDLHAIHTAKPKTQLQMDANVYQLY